jgi:hypothetical protein
MYDLALRDMVSILELTSLCLLNVAVSSLEAPAAEGKLSWIWKQCDTAGPPRVPPYILHQRKTTKERNIANAFAWPRQGAQISQAA